MHLVCGGHRGERDEAARPAGRRTEQVGGVVARLGFPLPCGGGDQDQAGARAQGGQVCGERRLEPVRFADVREGFGERGRGHRDGAQARTVQEGRDQLPGPSVVRPQRCGAAVLRRLAQSPQNEVLLADQPVREDHQTADDSGRRPFQFLGRGGPSRRVEDRVEEGAALLLPRSRSEPELGEGVAAARLGLIVEPAVVAAEELRDQRCHRGLERVGAIARERKRQRHPFAGGRVVRAPNPARVLSRISRQVDVDLPLEFAGQFADVVHSRPERDRSLGVLLVCPHGGGDRFPDPGGKVFPPQHGSGGGTVQRVAHQRIAGAVESALFPPKSQVDGDPASLTSRIVRQHPNSFPVDSYWMCAEANRSATGKMDPSRQLAQCGQERIEAGLCSQSRSGT